MRTIKLPYKTNHDFEPILRQYSIVVRWSFNRFKDGLSQKEIRQQSSSLNNIELLNAWLVQCAIKEGESIFKKNESDDGEQKVIFGSKKQFYRRLKNNITNDEFKKHRLLPLNIQGEMLQKGNRMFTLDIIKNNKIIFKLNKNTHIDLELPNLRNNYKNQLRELELKNKVKQKEIGFTYSIRLSLDYIYISFERLQNETLTPQNKTQKNRYIGIDLNPNEIGISVFENEKLLYISSFKFGTTDKNKMKFETYEISKKISNIFKSFNCNFVFVEDLTVKSKDHNKGRAYNKKVNNQWFRNIFIDSLEKRVYVIGGKLFKINPMYSSFIGNVMHDYNDAVNASIEIARRGFNVIINKNKKFYPEFNLSSLKDQWKEYFNDGVKSWKEFYILINNLELKYRVPNENLVLSHLSHKSKVNHYFYYLK